MILSSLLVLKLIHFLIKSEIMLPKNTYTYVTTQFSDPLKDISYHHCFCLDCCRYYKLYDWLSIVAVIVHMFSFPFFLFFPVCVLGGEKGKIISLYPFLDVTMKHKVKSKTILAGKFCLVISSKHKRYN